MKMNVTLILLHLLALTTFTAPVVRAQGSERMTFQQVQKVVASDGETDFNFGSDNFGPFGIKSHWDASEPNRNTLKSQVGTHMPIGLIAPQASWRPADGATSYSALHDDLWCSQISRKWPVAVAQ